MNTKTWVITVGGVVCAPLLLGDADTSQQKTPSKLMKRQRISKKAKTIFYKVALAWDLRNHVRAIFLCAKVDLGDGVSGPLLGLKIKGKACLF